MTCLRVLMLASAVLACAHAVSAQQSVQYASLSGRVTDQTGAVIRDAAVTARNSQTTLIATTITDQDGRFRFPYLRVGPYEVAVHLEGFRDTKRLLTLTVGAAFELPVTLALGVVETVTIIDEAPVLEANRSQIAGTVSQAEVQALPLNGRNFLELALLIPGVSPTNVVRTQLFPETSAVPGISLSINSQRNLSNGFIVDGLSANDDAAGLSGITYSIDAVEQVQVVTSGGQAELGRALGGYVNVVTKSGTNTLHGTLYDDRRDDRFNAGNPLSGSALPMRQSQYGGSVGGPVIPGRTFYFTNVEQRRLDQTGFTTISPVNAGVVNARLAAAGYQASPATTGMFANPVDSTNVLAKLDQVVRDGHMFGVRYSLYDVGSQNSRGAGGLSAPSASSALDNLDQTLAFSNTLTLSSRTVLETRAQFAYSDLQAPPTDLVGPAVSIAGVASFGRLSSSPTGRVNRMFQFVNNLSHQAGAHAFKVGADLLSNDDRITFPRAVQGTYAFSSMANFLTGVYNNAGFTQTFGETEVSQTNPNVGVYLQDEWKVSPRVTLNAGVRYELQFLETINSDANNISPRLGVTWSPFDSRRTLVRGSAGLFYDRVPLRALANALLSAGNTTDLTNLRQISLSLSPTQAAAPRFPNTLSGVVPSVTLVNLTTMDPDLQNAYSRQAGVEVEQQLGDRTTLSVGYQYVGGENLLMAVNQNVPACVPAGTNNGCRPNPNANNSQYSSVGESTYHGLHVSFVQRQARWGHYRISYTLSTSKNNIGEFFFSSPIDPFDLSKDWGRSDDDQRHRLVMYGAVQSSKAPATNFWEWISHGFELSGMVQAYSALPFNITSGVTTVQGTAGRPIVKWRLHRTQRRNRQRLLQPERTRESHVPLDRSTGAGSAGRGVQPHEPRESPHTEYQLRFRGVPTNHSSTFGQLTAGTEPRSFQFGLRASF